MSITVSNETIRNVLEHLQCDDDNKVLDALHNLTILLTSVSPLSSASAQPPALICPLSSDSDFSTLQKCLLFSCLRRYKRFYRSDVGAMLLSKERGEDGSGAASGDVDEDGDDHRFQESDHSQRRRFKGLLRIEDIEYDDQHSDATSSNETGHGRNRETNNPVEDVKSRIVELTYTCSSKLFSMRDKMRKWFEEDMEIATFLTSGHKDQYEIVRKLVVQQVGRLANHDTEYWLQRTELVHILVDAIADESLSVLREAQHFLVLLAKRHTETFFDSSVIMERFRDMAHKNDKLKIRVCDLFVNIASTSVRASQLFHQSSIISEVVGELDSNDPLTLLNVVEIFKNIGSTKHGVSALRDAGLLQKIVAVLQDSHDKRDFMVRDFVIEAIGTFCEHHDKAFDAQQIEVFYSIIRDAMNNAQQQVVAISSLGSIAGGSDHALTLLLRDSLLLKRYLDFFASDNVSDDAVRPIRHSIGHLLASPGASTDLCEQFYMAMQQLVMERTRDTKNVVTRIMDLLKTPFAEDRFSLFHVLHGICHHVWGVRAILSKYPLFVDFITDRSTESSKQGKEWKFVIVDRILKTATRFRQTQPDQNRLQPLLTPSQRQILSFFIHRGPYYQPSEARVHIATEST